MGGQIAPFAIGAQAVDNNRLLPTMREGCMQIRADEAGATGDHNHGCGI